MAKRITPQPMIIMKSTLVRPPRWFIVTKYDVKSGIDVTPGHRSDGERHEYMVAREKVDVTDQMRAILKRECPTHDGDRLRNLTNRLIDRRAMCSRPEVIAAYAIRESEGKDGRK